MIAPSKQVLPTERIREAALQAGADRADRRVALMVGLLGFFAFMPYAAIPVGHRSAIQIGNIVTGMMVLPVFAMRWRQRWLWIYPLLMAPMYLATLRIAFSDVGDVTLCFKVLVGWSLACFTLMVTQIYAPRYSIELITGIAIAAVVHVGVGIWQWRSFYRGEFPMLGLYENQSFFSVQDNAHAVMKYIRRPFGIFPEPSAMSACLAPWILFWLAVLSGQVRLKRRVTIWHRILFTTAAAGGLGLIILSQSGHAMVTLAAVILLAVLWFVHSKATLRTYLTIVAVFVVVLPIVVLISAFFLHDRLRGASALGNTSWEERAASMAIGLRLVVEGDIATMVFGLGPGHSAPAIGRAAQLPAVWSVSLTYLYETGLIGLAVIVWIAHYLIRIWKWTHRSVAFAAMTIVWLMGITITTSYPQLLPLWMTLGWLSVWPSLCEAPAQAQPVPARLQTKAYAPPTRRNGWSSDQAQGYLT